jgi:hypothetical protein
MGVSPMIAVSRDVGRYSDRINPSGAFFLVGKREDRQALAYLTGVLVNAAAYRGHGRDAHATETDSPD